MEFIKKKRLLQPGSLLRYSIGLEHGILVVYDIIINWTRFLISGSYGFRVLLVE